MRIIGLFMPILREILPLYYQFGQDCVMDSSKFEKAFGKTPLTSFDQAVQETLEWYKTQK